MARIKTVLGIAVVGVAGTFAALRAIECPDSPPIATSPSMMVRLYRDNPTKAESLYTGRRLRLAIRDGSFSILDYPAIIECYPPAAPGTAVTVGVCRGIKSAEYRGDNCHFVIVFDCCEHRDRDR